MEKKSARRRLRRLLGEEQRENAETFGERHADDGLDEDFAGRAGIAADGLGGLVADHADADGAAEETESAGNVAGHAGGFCEEEVHVLVGGFGCGCRRAHARYAPGGKVLMWCLGRVALVVRGIVVMIVAVVADEADVDRGEEGENDSLDEADEELHEIEHEDEAGAME